MTHSLPLFVKRKGSSNTFFAAGIILLLVGMSMATNLIVLVPLSITTCSSNQGTLIVDPPIPQNSVTMTMASGIYCYDSATTITISAYPSQGYELQGWCYNILPLPATCVTAQTLIINLTPGNSVAVIPDSLPCSNTCVNAAGSYTINMPIVQTTSGTTSVTLTTQSTSTLVTTQGGTTTTVITQGGTTTTVIITTTGSGNPQPSLAPLTDNQKVGIIIFVTGIALVIMGVRRREN